MSFGFGFGLPQTLSAVGGPSLSLNFINTSSLDPRITFTRASTGTYFNSAGTLTTAAINTPRFDYNPSTLASRGLLIEEQRTNLLTYSEQFDNAAWSKAGATVTADATSSPSGVVNADALVEDGTTGLHLAQQFFTFATATAYTVSIYAKPSGRTWVQVLLPAAAFTASQGGFFNLSGSGALGTVTGTPTSRTISALGNGWYRITVTATSTAAAGGNVAIVAASADGTTLYTGSNGSTAMFLWGAQLEAGAFVTSYIPTTTAAATRSADVASMTGTNFSSWFNASQGTLYAEYAVSGFAPTSAFPASAVLSDNTSNNRININSTNTGANLYGYAEVNTGGVSQAAFYGATSSTFGAGATRKSAIAYTVNDFAFTTQGLAAQTDSSGTVPTVDRLYLGIGPSGAGQSQNGYLRRVAFYNRRLTNNELQAITS